MSTALAAAGSGDEVWVKSGTYSGVHYIPNAVKVIGGFAGSETAASQSNPAANETILDGGDADRPVWIEDCATSTVLRGFTIANGSDTSFDGGGGMMIKNSSPVIVQCVFRENVASYFGGAVMITGDSNAKFVSCKFHDNGTGSGTGVAPLGGGAVFAQEGDPTFVNCLFYENKAGDGGAIIIQDGSPTLINCTVAYNEATINMGGGLFDQLGHAVVRNSIFWGNTAPLDGDQIMNGPGTPTTVTYSDVQGGWTGTGNINADPDFDAPGSGNFDIPGDSPCKDTGSNALVPADFGDLDWDANTTELLPKDLGGVTRIIQSTVDMGAYEGPYAEVIEQ
jgi:hypothetical protein